MFRSAPQSFTGRSATNVGRSTPGTQASRIAFLPGNRALRRTQVQECGRILAVASDVLESSTIPAPALNRPSVAMSTPLVTQEKFVRAFVDIVINQRRHHMLDDFISIDILEYRPFILSDRSESRDFGQDLRKVLTAFADLRVDVAHVVNAPGRMAVSLDLHGRNTGPLPGRAVPTLQFASWSAMAMLTLTEGRISEIRGVSDRYGMRRQLGLHEAGDSC